MRRHIWKVCRGQNLTKSCRFKGFYWEMVLEYKIKGKRGETTAYAFERREFEVDGIKYRIMETENTGMGHMDAVHTITDGQQTWKVKTKYLVDKWKQGKLK